MFRTFILYYVCNKHHYTKRTVLQIISKHMFFFLRIPWEVGTPGCAGKEYLDNGIKVNSLYIVFTETYVCV